MPESWRLEGSGQDQAENGENRHVRHDKRFRRSAISDSALLLFRKMLINISNLFLSVKGTPGRQRTALAIGARYSPQLAGHSSLSTPLEIVPIRPLVPGPYCPGIGYGYDVR